MIEDAVIWVPPMDIYELDNMYVVNAELPGVEKRDIRIQISGLELSIRGERKFDPICARESYERLEGHRGRFSRTFSLPEAVDHRRVKMELMNGVLHVILPKSGLKKQTIRGGR